MSDVTDMARAIRPYLSSLVGNDAPAIDRQIGTLLERAESGDEVDVELAELIDAAPATQAWADQFLNRPAPERRAQRSFQPLPGDATPIMAQRYVCPEGDYVWFRPSVGTPIPRCPTHNLILIRE